MSKIEKVKHVGRLGFYALLGIVGGVGELCTCVGATLRGLSLDAAQHNYKNHNTLMYTEMMLEKVKEDIDEVSVSYADVAMSEIFKKNVN